MAYGFYHRKKGSKYGNKKVECDGYTFDSTKEMKRYCELKLLQRAGAISDLELQKEFELIPNQYKQEERYGKNGKRLKDKQVLLERKCVYVCDFAYTDAETGKQVVEDCKSPITKTPVYKVKKKLMLYRYGIVVEEI